MIKGLGYYEPVVFENLPDGQEDFINFKNCVRGKNYRCKLIIRNTSENIIRFNWDVIENSDFNI